MNAPTPLTPGGQCWLLDFDQRVITALSDIAALEIPPNCFVWCDWRAGDASMVELPAILRDPPPTLRTAPLRELELADGWLAFGLAEGNAQNPTEPASSEVPASVNVLFSERALVTVEFGRSETLAKLRASWREDFRNFARSPGFFLFELSDHFTTSLQARMHVIESGIESLRDQLFDAGEGTNVFEQGAALIRQLQEMRRHAVGAAETFEELATRSSAFVSASTQPFIGRNAVRLERLAAELLQQRDALMAALNLHIGMTGYYTGLLLKRLTAFSIIFLPLSFLAGVFGMNFRSMPALHWEYGFALFCVIAFAITAVLLAFGKRGKWF